MSYTYEELESFAGDVNLALGGEGMSLDEMREALKTRLMPEGMEWPRFDDGEPVKIGDDVWDDGFKVKSIKFRSSDYSDSGVGFSISAEKGCLLPCHDYENGERVKRPPVLDADGVEIHKGDTVYAAPGVVDVGWTIPYTVGCVHDRRVDLICDGESEPSLINIDGERLTHKCPVLAKDSEPIKVGQTLYGEDGMAWHVCALHPGERYEVESDSTPSLEIRADGTVRYKRLKARWLTHEKPEPADTWEQLTLDAKLGTSAYIEKRNLLYSNINTRSVAVRVDILARAKALAERGAE